MSRSSRRRYSLLRANAPHRRGNKYVADFKAWECRHGRVQMEMCAWHANHGGGCPLSRFGIPCKAVQEGHWTLIFMDCWCRDERKCNERRKG